MKKLLNHIIRRLNYDYHRIIDVFVRKLCSPPRVMTSEETINYIIENKCSIARFGDGELSLINGANLGFQSYDNKLAKRLLKLIKISPNSNMLICLPNVFSIDPNFVNIEKRFWYNHLIYNRAKWYNLANKQSSYGNTFVSRFYSMYYNQEYSSKIYALLRKLWDSRDVVFIEGKYSRLGLGNNCFENVSSVNRILCPSKNAFNKYTKILEATTKIPKEALIIIALGPTATVLAYDLSLLGYQALDLGHIDLEYEWYRINASEKVPISGKFCNESFILGNQDKEVVGEINSEDIDIYKSQIIIDLSDE